MPFDKNITSLFIFFFLKPEGDSFGILGFTNDKSKLEYNEKTIESCEPNKQNLWSERGQKEKSVIAVIGFVLGI